MCPSKKKFSNQDIGVLVILSRGAGMGFFVWQLNN